MKKENGNSPNAGLLRLAKPLTTRQMKNFKKVSFFALVLGWIGQIITHIVWSNLRFENASGGDTGVVIFWSSFFLLIYYGLFILIPRKKLSNFPKKSEF